MARRCVHGLRGALLAFAAYASVGNLVLVVADDREHGRELWLSDGTAEGTRLLWDLVPGVGSSAPREFTAMGQKVFSVAHTPAYGPEPPHPGPPGSPCGSDPAESPRDLGCETYASC